MTPEPTPKKGRRSRAWEATTTGAQRPINLEARFANGNACFLPYSYLIFCHFDQGGVIDLHFTKHILRVEGRHLRDLYEALNRHAVSYIQESESDELLPESELVISSVAILEEDDAG